MNTTERKVGKLFLVFAGVCLLALPLVVLTAFSSDSPPAEKPASPALAMDFDHKGQAVFNVYDRVSKEYLEGTSSARTLDEYYSRRQYLGAPPIIPHTVEEPGKERVTCLACHEKGGWTADLKRHTPLTPHPEQTACRQCHVGLNGDTLFADHLWMSVAPPRLGRAYLPGAPPPIPHTLQNRGDCVACHVGPGAVATIRVEHPQRGNCRQCHVPDEYAGMFERPAK